MRFLATRHFNLFLSSLFLAFFFSLFGVSSVFALDDIYTPDGQSNFYQAICGSNYGADPCDTVFGTTYPTYLKLEFSLSNCQTNSNLNIVIGGSAKTITFGSCSTVFVPLSSYSGFTGMQLGVWRSNGSGTVRISTTDSIGSACPVIDGTLSITENGTFDVSSYQYASVDVPPEPGDYDDEFNGLIVAIYTCGAVVIMLYFFYMIYGVLIRSSKR